MRWGNPNSLPWLLLLAALCSVIWMLHRKRLRDLQRLLEPPVWPSVLGNWRAERRRQRLILWCAAILLIGVALARPQWGFRWEEVRRRGLDIVVVLDTSWSMSAPDFRPSRLQQAKWGIREFIERLKADRVGLVLFSGSAFLQCPLTIDYAAFLMLLDDAYCGIIPRGGTAIEQGLRAAIAAFDEAGEADRVILLVSDGEDHEGNPLQLVDELKRKNIRVYAVGIGTPEGELLPARPDQGGSFFKDREGKVVKSALNEALLEQLALATGGIYVRATPGNFGADRIYEHTVKNLRREERESQLLKVYEERYMWFAGFALLLLALEALLSERKDQGVFTAIWNRALASRFSGSKKFQTPRNSTKLFRTVLLFCCVGGLLANLPVALAEEATAKQAFRDGIKAYTASNFSEAAEAFLKAAREAAGTRLDPAIAYFNAAAALHQAQQWADSEKASQEALRSSEKALQFRAYLNRGAALHKQAEAAHSSQQPQVAAKAIEEALEMYESALLLEPKSREAKINYELALRLKEEIQQVTQRPETSQQQKQEQQQPQPDQQEGASQEEQQQPHEEENEQTPPASETQASQSDSSQQETSSDVKKEMTREEALRILDAMRQEELRQREQYPIKLGKPVPVEKEW